MRKKRRVKKIHELRKREWPSLEDSPSTLRESLKKSVEAEANWW